MNKTKDNVDSRVLSIFRFLDDAFLSGDYDLVDNILENIDVGKWDENELIAFLSVTYPNRDSYYNRKHFYRKVYDKFDDELGIERTERVLEGLK